MRLAAAIAVLAALAALLLVLRESDVDGPADAAAVGGAAVGGAETTAPRAPIRAVHGATAEGEPTGAARESRIPVAAAPAPTALDVLVTDDLERPIVGAIVTLRTFGETDEHGSRSVIDRDVHRTDAAGSVLLAVDPGREYGLRAQGPPGAGHREAYESIAPLEAGATRSLTLRLMQPRGPFHGRVTDAATGAPLAAVAVHARRAQRGLGQIIGGEQRVDLPPPDRTPDAVTDADGRFSLPLERFGDGHATLHLAGYVQGSFDFGATARDVSRPVALRLHRGVALVGRVSGMAPRADAHVIATCAAYHLRAGGDQLSFGGHAAWRADVADDASYALDGLPPEVPLDVRLAIDGSTRLTVPDPVVLAPGERRTLDLDLDADGAIFVRTVESDGRPAPDVSIALYPASEATRPSYVGERWTLAQWSTTGADGTARFEGVPPGEWLVAPRDEPTSAGDGSEAPDPARSVAELPAAVTVGEGGEDAQVTVVVHRGLYVSGRVLTPEREPWGSFHAGAVALDSGRHLGARGNSDGTFRIGPLEPGRQRLYASVFGGPYTAPEAVVVEAGAADVELRLARGGLLDVVAVDAGTGERVTARVGAHPVDGGDYMLWTASSDRTATFRGLAPGRYHLVASTADGRVGSIRNVTVAADDDPGEPWAVPVSVGGSVRVRYEGPQDYATVRILQDGVCYAADGLRSGTSQVFPAPLGPVTVRVTGSLDGLTDAGEYRRTTHEETVTVEPDTVPTVAHRGD